MLNSKQRLSRKNVDFVLKKGDTIHHRFFVIKFAKNKILKDNPPKFAIAISKKHCKLATDRNRHRRRIYDILRQIEFSLTDLQIVIICKKPALDIDLATLKKELEISFKKIQI